MASRRALAAHASGDANAPAVTQVRCCCRYALFPAAQPVCLHVCSHSLSMHGSVPIRAPPLQRMHTLESARARWEAAWREVAPAGAAAASSSAFSVPSPGRLRAVAASPVIVRAAPAPAAVPMSDGDRSPLASAVAPAADAAR